MNDPCVKGSTPDARDCVNGQRVSMNSLQCKYRIDDEVVLRYSIEWPSQEELASFSHPTNLDSVLLSKRALDIEIENYGTNYCIGNIVFLWRTSLSLVGSPRWNIYTKPYIDV